MWPSWRSLRMTMLAVAVTAVGLSGLRELPSLLDCYTVWRGVQRARSDVELIGAGSGLDSASGRRAMLNAQQSQAQAEAFWRENRPSPIGLACVSVSGLLSLGLAFGGPIAGLRVIIRGFAGHCRAAAGRSLRSQS
jgi:hypothetical protein